MPIRAFAPLAHAAPEGAGIECASVHAAVAALTLLPEGGNDAGACGVELFQEVVGIGSGEEIVEHIRRNQAEITLPGSIRGQEELEVR